MTDSPPLAAHLIQNQLATPSSFSLHITDAIDSTNEFIKNYPSKQFAHWPVCLAESQTAGRGRWGKQWHSPAGRNIYLSCGYRSQQPLTAIPGLSLVIGLSVIKALAHLNLPEPLMLKWPNDIYYLEQKLAGILVETVTDADGTRVIIGVGLNVNMPEQVIASIQQPWTSLQIALGRSLDRNPLVAELLTQIKKAVQSFEQQPFTVFLPEWRRHDYLYNKSIQLKLPHTTITGIAKGINEMAALLVIDDQGHLSAHPIGEAQVRAQ